MRYKSSTFKMNENSLSPDRRRLLEAIRMKNGNPLLGSLKMRFEIECLIESQSLFLEEKKIEFDFLVEKLKEESSKTNSPNEVLFSLDIFSKEKETYLKILKLKREGIKLVRSSMKCRRCGENKVMVYEMQLRSADEPMSRMCVCQHCGEKWRIG